MSLAVELALDTTLLEGALRGSDERIQRARTRFLDQASRVTIDEMRRLAPARTGRLRDSIQILERREEQVSVGPTVDYVKHVVRGTGPHEILPRRARALRFEMDGQVVFAKRVQHPGTEPKRFVEDTALQISEVLPDLMARIVIDEVRALYGV